MNHAFVLDNEAILCHQTLNGWQPISVSLRATTIDSAINDNTVGKCPPYELGRVQLQADLDVSSSSAIKIASESADDLLATSAISYHYAKNHQLTLPIITDSDDLTDNTDSHIFAFIAYRHLITLLPAALANQLSQAIQLLRWQADTQFCSRCSAPVSLAKSGERSMVCHVCRLRQYPRVQPCVITAITRPNPSTGEMQILLAHHHRYGQTSLPLQYGLIAGFVEVGESLEHAVVREVAEEVGISLKNIRYVSSQPWPFPSNLMVGFRATYTHGDIVLQEDELSHAEFFDLSNLPKIPFIGSIAYDLIAQIAIEQGVSLS